MKLLSALVLCCAMGWLLSQAPATAAGAQAPSANVAWLSAAGPADVDRAFAQARQVSKPVLLYWGAKWCPPCNQLKATLFNRQDFAELAQSFVPVHVDGDQPGAQQLGQRFKVSGYPTLVVYSAAGQEITRVPGEVDAPQALAVLKLGLAGGRPVKAVLADALASRALSPSEWRLLAFYSWDTDEQQVLPKAALQPTLARLAAACPAAESEAGTRLWLKMLASAADGAASRAKDPGPAAQERTLRVLGDPVQVRQMEDVITAAAADMVQVLTPADARARHVLVAAFDGALRRLQFDTSLSRGDRIGAAYARIELARLGLPKEATRVELPATLLQDLRQQVAADEREISDPYERQAVITTAAAALGLAGLWGDSDALLEANLERSHSPYYLMSALAGNARKQGRPDDALRWYAQAFERSEGPATRLQWGTAYLSALVDLAPQDAGRIEEVARRLFEEAALDPAALQGRSGRSLRRASDKLLGWNEARPQAATMRRLAAERDRLCARVGQAQGQYRECAALLHAGARKSA